MDDQLKKRVVKRCYLVLLYCVVVWLIGEFISKPAAIIIMIVSFAVLLWYFYINYKDIMKQFNEQTDLLGHVQGILDKSNEGVDTIWQKLKVKK
jgi:predicted PurR-regulated permease PerM